MAAMRANRLQVGTATWIAEERASAMEIVQSETDEFTFSARNEVEWLNEHMAEIFNENQINVAEIFKTPGKLRGKTPRTIRKNNLLGERAPLSDVFGGTPHKVPSPLKQLNFEKPAPTFRVAEDLPTPLDEAGPSISNPTAPAIAQATYNTIDSGYHGSQPIDATSQDAPVSASHTPFGSPLKPVQDHESFASDEDNDDENIVILGRDSDMGRSIDGTSQPLKEERAPILASIHAEQSEPRTRAIPAMLSEDVSQAMSNNHGPTSASSPRPNLPYSPSPQKVREDHPATVVVGKPTQQHEPVMQSTLQEPDDANLQDSQSPSDGSSPMRPIVRKSSLNFASLPAREPLTNKKSIGNRISRTSQLEQPRTSYYGRQTGGKSFERIDQEEFEEDEMDVDVPEEGQDDTDLKIMRQHNKTSTQRLQDQISKLGQSQNLRPSKSSSSNTAAQLHTEKPPQTNLPREDLAPDNRQRSPHKPAERKSKLPPGAFPEDEDDSWIGPPTTTVPKATSSSPRPVLTKSHTADVMEDVHSKNTGGDIQFSIPKRGDQHRNMSPVREPAIPERTTSTLGHVKSVSTSVLRSPRKAGDSPIQRKPVAVSNPNPSIASNNEGSPTTPPKSPGRSFRGSPLKAAKDKFSSILKTSRGLFASSAAVSAEAKSSALSPVPARSPNRSGPSLEDVLSVANESVSYPDLAKVPSKTSLHSLRMPDSPFKHTPRRTRASTEKEEKRKEEEAKEARAEKEVKEAQKVTDRLAKERMKVKEEVRAFHEQAKVAALQKGLESRKEHDQASVTSQVNSHNDTRTSPRRHKALVEPESLSVAADNADNGSGSIADNGDQSQGMPPPPVRPKSQIGRPAVKRPLKPAKELAKAKPPTVIRVDTGSQRGQQYHPSNATLAATLQESLSSSQSNAPSSQALRHKASTSSIQSKASSSGIRSGATKALEAAARKKEQDELVAAKKREAKLELERQRAAAKEEERRKEEQQRRQEAERQREIQKERERAASIADAKKAASRQAIEKRRQEMEKAKETRPPPPPLRSQTNAEGTSSNLQDKALPPLPAQTVTPSKAPQANQSTQRAPAELGRSINAVMPHSSKVPPKRPLQQDIDDHHSRPAIQRNGPSFQNEQQPKRRKTDDFDEDEDMTDNQPKMTAPPIRQSSIRQKDAPIRSLFPNGYTNAPPSNNLQRSILISQHNLNQSKPTHPMDLAQLSKAPIPFASSSGPSGAQHKTPARPGAPNGMAKSGVKSGAKSAAKSSPRYQDGEKIDLPEIHTDSEDEDSDAGDFVALGWTNSPDLRRQLVSQENIDPAEVFGNPGPLNMEEVFSKSKDRFHKFRARTSSANWSGQDRLTEDEIKKDLEARDRVRRQGGWTYDTMV